ncbi:hypothetical protein FZEAL_904 [Fusarium zealandicum]|uniref:Alcohol dehydrogenase-like C-terminal domain-containing protein n=1 Tax=Fusarium zealandicum TaxID=1053134 RepID=A0A8H4UUL3_9HYPO|nr:hypothetical protein FZEAL_904 [Fusarium zealandicum]
MSRATATVSWRSRPPYNAHEQFHQLKKDNPYGFDVVVKATDSVRVLEDSINYGRRGGALVVCGACSSADRVSWSLSKIFGDEITILGSFSETYMFPAPATIDHLDSGEVKTEGIVNKTFKLEQFGEALESIKNKFAIKATIVFDDEEPEEVEVAESTKAEAGDEPEPLDAEKPEIGEKKPEVCA